MFLNSSIQTNDDRISIDGYNLIRTDNSSDSKRGGVCIYYKKHILFCINQNTISYYGVDVSIFDKCHHDIIFDRINIRVPLPPAYVRDV